MPRKSILILALALTALAPAGARADLPSGFIGISPQHPGNADDYRLMREAGIQSVRLPLNWASVQPENPRRVASDWSAFDRDVGLAAAEGIEILPFFYGSPRWVAGDWRALPVRTVRQRRAWASFVREAVRRYGPGGSFWSANPGLASVPVRRWEIWNEQNIVSFMKHPDPARYATLLRIAGRVLHRADRDSEVIVGGFFGRPLQIPPNVASGDFLRRLYEVPKIRRYFDGVGLHPYVAGVRGMAVQLRTLRRIMRRNGDARTPLYVTELGWGSRDGPTRWERGVWGQANQLSRSFALLSRQRLNWRVGGVWWFSWTDEGGGCQFCGSAGLLNTAREAKPSWYRFTAWTGGDPDIVPRAPLDE